MDTEQMHPDVARRLTSIVESSADESVECERAALLGRSTAEIAKALSAPWAGECPAEQAQDYLRQVGVDDPTEEQVTAVCAQFDQHASWSWSRLDISDIVEDEDDDYEDGDYAIEPIKALESRLVGLDNDARYWDLRRAYGDYSPEVLRHLEACADVQDRGENHT
jgi:hypothetical protein